MHMHTHKQTMLFKTYKKYFRIMFHIHNLLNIIYNEHRKFEAILIHGIFAPPPHKLRVIFFCIYSICIYMD